MTDPEIIRISKALGALSLASAGAELDPKRLDLYLEILNPYPFDRVYRSIIELMARATFFPTPAEILKPIINQNSTRAADAWAITVALAASGKRKSADAAIEQTVRLVGGWERIANTPTSAIHFIERRFVSLFTDVEAKSAMLTSTLTAKGLLR